MKKKLLSFACITLLVLSAASGALARTVHNYSNITLDRGTGTYVGSAVKSGNGNAGLACNPYSNASMYMEVRKPDGVAASNYRIFNGLGSDDSVPYKTDGNGQSLGRDGYTYKCRLAHRSQSQQSTATASGGWWP